MQPKSPTTVEVPYARIGARRLITVSVTQTNAAMPVLATTMLDPYAPWQFGGACGSRYRCSRMSQRTRSVWIAHPMLRDGVRKLGMAPTTFGSVRVRRERSGEWVGELVGELGSVVDGVESDGCLVTVGPEVVGELVRAGVAPCTWSLPATSAAEAHPDSRIAATAAGRS